MKKLLFAIFVALLVLQTASSSTSEDTNPTLREINKAVPCGDAKSVMQSLISGYREVPFWMGEDTKSGYVLLVNEKSKTWTLLQYNDETACILGSGVNHRQVYNGPVI
jgi:hypothetical protein